MAKFTWQNGTLVSKAKVEINGTIYEVDPEEYSGATPLSAGNLNAMQDGIYEDIGNKANLNTESKTNLVVAINEVNEKNNYSTDEHIVGEWIDGKPVYEKTFIIPKSQIPSTRVINYNHNIANMDMVVSYEGLIERNSSGVHTFNTLPWFAGTSTDANNWNSHVNDINTTQFNVTLGQNAYNYGLLNVYVTLRYTKTTD